MKKSFIVPVIAALLAVALGAADISGVWSLRLTTKGDESAPRAAVTLKQEGDKVTGSCVIDNTEETFTVTGQVVGDTVTWRCASKGPIEASFKGAINETGREMTGSWTTGRSGGTFKGSKRAR
jgi:hypothetical protein